MTDRRRVDAVPQPIDFGGRELDETCDVSPGESAPPTSAEDGPDRVGDRVGPFTLHDLLGYGGMGAVYRAVDAVGRSVALKMLHNGSDERVRRRFIDEARALAAVRHENVVRILEVVEEEGERYYTMELVEGVSLLEACRGASLDDILRMFSQLARALEAVHAASLMHRDIKPTNVLVGAGESARVKLLDFGVAASTAADGPRHTAKNALVGTPHYMAPEQLSGGTVTEAADVYAFGLLLYECLVGERAFSAHTFGELVVKHLSVVPPRVSQARAVDESLDALVAACLEKQAAARPTMAEVARFIGAYDTRASSA